MKRTLMALGCVLALLLSACTPGGGAGQTQPPEGAYGIYFSALGGSHAVAAVDCEYRQLAPGIAPVPGLMELLLAGPESTELLSPFPQTGVRMLSWKLEDGQLSLDLSEQYGELSGVDLTVADYCIALTLCQAEGVESVYITVAGEELPFRHSQQLRAEDVILSGAEEEPLYVGVNLWFPRESGGGLGVEYRQVIKTEDIPLLEAVLEAWLSGPEFEGMRHDVPEGTQLRSATLEDGVCTVDLSAQFYESAPADPATARLLLYSLVNTMGGLETVEGVQLLIEGERITTYGSVRAGRPLAPDLQLEKELTNS